MPKTVSRRRTVPNEELVLFLKFLNAQAQERQGKTDRENFRDALIQWLVADDTHWVIEDEEKGHKVHNLDEPIQFGGVVYQGFMHQKKAGPLLFLEDAAVALCEEKGFDLDDYTTRYPDQDKITRLYADDKITEEEWAGLFEKQDDTWAFVPVKA